MLANRQLLILLSAALFLYAPSLYFGFYIFDDAFHITDNPLITNFTSSSLLQAWVESRSPIIINIWQVIGIIFGTDSATPYRLVNILVHGLNSFLVFKIMSAKVRKQHYAFWGALLFLATPIHVESIVWVSSLRGTLSATVFFALILAAIEFQGKYSLERSVTYLLCFIVGMLIKPSIATLPLVLALWDFTFYQKKLSQSFAYYGPLFLSSLLFVFVFQSHILTTDFFTFDYLQRVQIMFVSLGHSLRLLLLPWPLSISYGLTPFELMTGNTASYLLFSASFFMLFTILIFTSIRLLGARLRVSLLIFSCLLLTLLPTSGIIPFDFQNISLVADRYLYIPSFFLFFLMINAIDQIYENKLVSNGFVVLLVLFLTSSTYQIAQWQSSSNIISKSIPLEKMNDVLLPPYVFSLIQEGKYDQSEAVLNQKLDEFPEALIDLAFQSAYKSGNRNRLLELTFYIEGNPGLTSYMNHLNLARGYRDVHLHQVADFFFSSHSETIIDRRYYQATIFESSFPINFYSAISYYGLISHYAKMNETERALELAHEALATIQDEDYHIHFYTLIERLRN